MDTRGSGKGMLNVCGGYRVNSSLLCLHLYSHPTMLVAIAQAVLDKKWVLIEDIDRSPPDVVSVALISIATTSCVL